MTGKRWRPSASSSASCAHRKREQDAHVRVRRVGSRLQASDRLTERSTCVFTQARVIVAVDMTIWEGLSRTGIALVVPGWLVDRCREVVVEQVWVPRFMTAFVGGNQLRWKTEQLNPLRGGGRGYILAGGTRKCRAGRTLARMCTDTTCVWEGH